MLRKTNSVSDERVVLYSGKTMFHVTTKKIWQAQKAKKFYEPERFKADGFIHCSANEVVAQKMANKIYGQTQDEIVILKIQTNLVRSETRIDDEKRDYPHIYGLLNTNAVKEEINLIRNKNGELSFPETYLTEAKIKPFVFQLFRHTVLSFNNIRGLDFLTNEQFALNLWEQIKVYQKANKINIKNQGMRIIIEVEKDGKISLAMVNKHAAAQACFDWFEPKQLWNPGLEEGKGGFMEIMANKVNTSADLEEIMPKVYSVNGNREVFAIKDINPKAEDHYVILAKNPHASCLDKNFRVGEIKSTFTAEEWLQSLQLAVQLFKPYAEGRTLRLVSNIGQGFQVGPRFHIHVMWDKDFPNLFPEIYGFEVDPKTNVVIVKRENALYLKFKELVKNYSNKLKSEQKKPEKLIELRRLTYQVLEELRP